MKIVFIGGGSVLWTPRLGCDLLLEPALDGAELHLVDIDREAVRLTAAYLRTAVRQAKLRWQIRVSGLEAALKGADLVLVSISTGGFEAMDVDYTVPEKYGIYHTVADTVGPGGIARTWRNVPVFQGIARKMAKLCPGAWMLHVTNPLTQLTRAVELTGAVPVAGLCHEYTGMLSFLQRFFGKEPGEVDSLCVGVNHFTVLKNLQVKGVREPEKQLTLANYLRFAETHRGGDSSGTVDDLVARAAAAKLDDVPEYFNFYVNDNYGFFPMASCCHVCENLPGFNTSEAVIDRMKLYRKGVLPRRPKAKADRQAELRQLLAERKPVPEMSGRSKEMLCDAVVGLLTGESRRIIAARGNAGQIDNLPRQAAVETWSQVSGCGINPVTSGAVPAAAKGYLEQIITEQELTVAAAVSGDFDTAAAAVAASPMVPDKSIAPALARDLILGNRQYLPQFKNIK